MRTNQLVDLRVSQLLSYVRSRDTRFSSVLTYQVIHRSPTCQKNIRTVIEQLSEIPHRNNYFFLLLHRVTYNLEATYYNSVLTLLLLLFGMDSRVLYIQNCIQYEVLQSPPLYSFVK